MSAASRLAWRQARGAWRHFVLLGACVALGVAALVAVGSFAATLDHTLAREAKALTGGDLEIRAARPLDGDVAAALADLEARGATVVRVRELAAMARGADGRALLVELKAPGAGYPLYGRFEAAPPDPLAALLAGGGAVVQREALERLGIRVGDRLTLGAATFTVRGTVEREPDRSASLVTLGPRVFVAADAIARTGLVQPGSRVRYRALVRLRSPRARRGRPWRGASPIPACAWPRTTRRSPASDASSRSSRAISASSASPASSSAASAWRRPSRRSCAASRGPSPY